MYGADDRTVTAALLRLGRFGGARANIGKFLADYRHSERSYKLFYMGFPYRKNEWVRDEIGSALAMSKDGLDWERPVLNQVEIGGSTINNRFFVTNPKLRWGQNKFMDVIHDPSDPEPKRRYKGLLGAMGREPVVPNEYKSINPWVRALPAVP